MRKPILKKNEDPFFGISGLLNGLRNFSELKFTAPIPKIERSKVM